MAGRTANIGVGLVYGKRGRGVAMAGGVVAGIIYACFRSGFVVERCSVVAICAFESTFAASGYVPVIDSVVRVPTWDWLGSGGISPGRGAVVAFIACRERDIVP